MIYHSVMTDLDVADTARLIGVTERTVRRWLREGRLSGYRVGGRIRISEGAIREVHAPYGSRSTEPPPAATGTVDPIARYLADPERLRARREAAARAMDTIAAGSRPPTGTDDTAEALIREVRLGRDRP